MENVENAEEDLKQNTYIMYENRYEFCQKKIDKLTLVSDRVSLLRGIAFVIATLLKIKDGAEKSNSTVVL